MKLHKSVTDLALDGAGASSSWWLQPAAQLQAPFQDQSAVVCLGLLGHYARQARLQLLYFAGQLRKLRLLALAEALLRLWGKQQARL